MAIKYEFREKERRHREVVSLQTQQMKFNKIVAFATIILAFGVIYDIVISRTTGERGILFEAINYGYYILLFITLIFFVRELIGLFRIVKNPPLSEPPNSI